MNVTMVNSALTKIRIGHDGSGMASGWHLDRVVVRHEQSGDEWTFLAQRWLDKNEVDGAVSAKMNGFNAYNNNV